MVDGGGTGNYSYDNADRVTAVSRVGGDTWGYLYDEDDNVTRRTYPDTTQINATFDRDGNLQTVVQGTNTTTFAYDAAGRLTTATLPSGNGYVESRAYDNAGRLTQVKNQKGTAVLSQFTRTLDPAGNPTLVATLRGTTTTNEAMQYDASNRLTKWCQAASCTGATKWISYSYDPVGNRTQQVRTGVTTPGTTNYTYDNADQLTQTVAGTTTTNFTYDQDGNQTAQGTRTFAYDLAGRMKSTTSGSTTTNYTYDGNDLRLTRATGATINTRYSWDTVGELPELALEKNASNALIRRYVQGPAGPISVATSATAINYYHRDAIGSVTDITDTAGAAQWKYEYEPFGAALTTTKVKSTASANQIGFTGEYQDPEWANYHLRARQYDPATGRFLAQDPVTPPGVDQSVSRFAYVGGRPGVWTDPSGRDRCWIWQDGCEPTDPWTRKIMEWGERSVSGDMNAASAAGISLFADVGEYMMEVGQSFSGTTDNAFDSGYLWAQGCPEEAWASMRLAIGNGANIASAILGRGGRGGRSSGGRGSSGRQGATSPVAPASRGSSGRTTPRDLTEQLAMEQVKSAPMSGTVIANIVMKDQRWPASAGWVKMKQTVNGVEVHYVRNTVTGVVDDFKFVG